MKTQQIYDMVIDNEGIKCFEIIKQIDITQASASGILSRLKKLRYITNRGGRWYKVSDGDRPRIIEIKAKLVDIAAPFRPGGPWYEGYISAYTDSGIIDEREHDMLLDWLIDIKE